MTPRAQRLVQLVWTVVLVAAAIVIGENYIRRLPNHAGYFLVAVDDVVADPPARPRHTVIIVADGLGQRFARGMQATAKLQAHGQCRVTDVGPISVSRPVYAVISTGLEQDRTGARNNDETSPLAAESLWDSAQAAGLVVAGVSDVPWWQQLFPGGFDRYAVRPQDDDYFADLELGDLTLVHPSYVDHAGHDAGADSQQYAEAVARLDRELGAFLARLDLSQDLIIFTADHGHHPKGGHGGRQPEIANVLTCFSGQGIARRGDGDAIHSHAIAGTVAVLLGLRFPRHMRAGDDDLDHALAIADPAAFSPAYLADRRAAIERYRHENAARRAQWLGAPGSWDDLQAHEGRAQWLRLALVVIVTIAGFLAAARLRRLTPRAALELAALCLGVFAATVLLHIIVLGSFDWTAINLRERYLRAAPPICLAPALVTLALRRRHESLLADQLTLATFAFALDAGHIVVFGWPVGYPLPGPAMLLFPFFASIFLGVHALLAAMLAALATIGALRPLRRA